MDLKFAAIDIGSNAIRFQLAASFHHQTDGENMLKKIEYIRFPLRLGEEAFSKGCITEQTVKKFMSLMKLYKLIIDLHEVDGYMACATSAMREATNGTMLKNKIYNKFGIDVQIISGSEEAKLVGLSVSPYLSEQRNYFHIDVGGGSTEFNIYEGQKNVKSYSFKVGSIKMGMGNNIMDEWQIMKQWVKHYIAPYNENIVAIGTGGNISKIFDLAGKRNDGMLSIKKIKEVRKYIEKHTLKERIQKLKINPDRVDVILPATNIYIKTMEWAKADYIINPNAGLKEGMLLYMLKSYPREKYLFV